MIADKKIYIIVAIAKNNAIGKDGDLLWHLSEDLKRFKRITSGHTIIMGRKTFESFGSRALPKEEILL
jgi:dihydrofolate reductase